MVLLLLCPLFGGSTVFQAEYYFVTIIVCIDHHVYGLFLSREQTGSTWIPTSLGRFLTKTKLQRFLHIDNVPDIACIVRV